MKRIVQLLPIFILLAASLDAQNFISSTALGSKTKAQIASATGYPMVDYDVKYWRILYTTTGLNGQLDTVSGLVVAPNDQGAIFPRLVYQHGTSGSKTDVPSYNVNSNGEGVIGWLFAGLGYVALLPDYLGLGVSDGPHPYVHAATEAAVAADMLRALPAFAATQNIFFGNQLFITGYSQGGHASAAFHRFCEEDPNAEFSVTAATHLSGPYSLSGVMRDLILSQGSYLYPAYIPNTALGYQAVYGNLYTNLTDFFKQPYAGLIAQYANGQIDLTNLNIQLVVQLSINEGGSIPTRMIKDDVRQAIINDPNHPVNVALRDNDLFNWGPQRPTRIYYCQADDQVPYQNSIVARDSMQAYGATDLEVVNLNSNGTHATCYDPTIENTIDFFAQYQVIDFMTSQQDVTGEGTLRLSPNPARDGFFIRQIPSAARLSVVDTYGKLVLDMPVQAGDAYISLPDAASGVYVVRLAAGGAVRSARLSVQR